MNVHAFTVLGIKLPSDALEIAGEEPGCEHSLPGGAKFCPTCGAPVTKFLSS